MALNGTPKKTESRKIGNPKNRATDWTIFVFGKFHLNMGCLNVGCLKAGGKAKAEGHSKTHTRKHIDIYVYIHKKRFMLIKIYVYKRPFLI